MKFGQLIEYTSYIPYISYIYPYTKCGGEASPRTFYKKSKLTISLDRGVSKYMLTTCFYLI